MMSSESVQVQQQPSGTDASLYSTSPSEERAEQLVKFLCARGYGKSESLNALKQNDFNLDDALVTLCLKGSAKPK
ncbi:hypothetical protein TRVA0_008S01904 [Trichomonascus vanleenenianus]|uniref:uncharacterized protein n=1 Tax=Trichomonascus vanleenenianus TaxID=2268995 RepID=UPI003ECB8BFE